MAEKEEKVYDESEISEDVKAKQDELEMLTLDEQIAFKKNSIKDSQDLLEKMQKLVEVKQKLDEKEEALGTKERGLIERESQVVIDREEAKKSLEAARTRILNVETEYKKKWDAEDKKRQLQKASELSMIDDLAASVFNASPQELNNRLQKKFSEILEKLMLNYGLKPEFDSVGKYITLDDKSGMTPPTPKERPEQYIPTDGDMPVNIKRCYAMSSKLYKTMMGEQIYGMSFCQKVYPTIKMLSEAIPNKSEQEIAESQEELLSRFQFLHKVIMTYAEAYQDYTKQDIGEWSQYLVDKAIILEKYLSVGVDNFDGREMSMMPSSPAPMAKPASGIDSLLGAFGIRR